MFLLTPRWSVKHLSVKISPCFCVGSGRSNVIEKLEALELEHAERMEVEERPAGVRQGRSESRRFQREVMNTKPQSSLWQTLWGLYSRLCYHAVSSPERDHSVIICCPDYDFLNMEQILWSQWGAETVLLCFYVQQKKGTHTGLEQHEWIHDDRIFTFRWTSPLKQTWWFLKKTFSSFLALARMIFRLN